MPTPVDEVEVRRSDGEGSAEFVRDFLDAPPLVGAAAGTRRVGIGGAGEAAGGGPAREGGRGDDEEGCECGPAEDRSSRRPDLVVRGFDHADDGDISTASFEICRGAGLVAFGCRAAREQPAEPTRDDDRRGGDERGGDSDTRPRAHAAARRR